MKILIPTAKELNSKAEKVTGEKLSKKTKSIINEFSSKTIDELKSIYKIKDDKAKEEYGRWAKLTKKDVDSYPALELFNGLMYRNIARQSFNEDDSKYISDNVFITSALYGVINAYYPISEHRLDFLQKCKIGDTSLKNFWREDYDKVIENDDFVISLLSSEFEEVFSPASRDKFIKINFMEDKDGVLKTHSTISKKARGKFLTELIKGKVTNIEQIKNIEFDNFKYIEDQSSEKLLVFIAKR
jgi:UPF0246 protein SGO_1307